MNTVPATRRPRQRQQRAVALLVAPMDNGRNAVVRIRSGKEATLYFLDRIPSDWGVAFSLTKTSGGEPPYHLNLNADAPSCDCLGCLAHGHCKHVDGVRVLLERGLVSADPPVIEVTGPDLHEGGSYKPGHDSDLAF